MDIKYNEYILFLKNYRDELVAHLHNEREKRRALLDNKIDKLEAMLKAQQAEMMKLHGLESKRDKLQSKLGLPGAKAKELLEAIDDREAKESIEALFTEITDITGHIREQNRQSLELAKVNLKVLHLILQDGETQTRIKIYGPDSGVQKVYSTGDAFEETV